MHCQSCGSLCCYADDSTFYFASDSLDTLEHELSRKYQNISEFMCNNRLKLNDNKTHLMLLATENSWRSKLKVDSLTLLTSQNEPVVRTSKCENLLGCAISQNLKWTEHILLGKSSLVRQLGTRINALKNRQSVLKF